MGQRTRKLMTMHKTLHPRDRSWQAICIKKEGGKGLASIEDSVDASIERLEDHIEKHEGGLITAIRNDSDNITDYRVITKKQIWKEKQLYGRFKRIINISHETTRKANFKREAESLLAAAQNNTVRTNHIKVRIVKTQQNSRCRLCGERDETINHIISEYSKLAQKKNKTRYDGVGKVIVWEMCKKLKFDYTNKWYKHNPVSLLENDTHKLLCGFDQQRDHLISARRPSLKIIKQ